MGETKKLTKMFIHEVDLDDTVLAQLIRFSEDWTAENSCYGYRPNDKCLRHIRPKFSMRERFLLKLSGGNGIMTSNLGQIRPK